MTGRPALLVLTTTFPRWEGDPDPPFVFELCRRLIADYRVHVICPHCRGSETEEVFHGIRVSRFRYFISAGERLAYDGGILPKLRKTPLLAGLLPFFLAGQFLAVVRALRRNRFDLVHAHWILPQGLTAVAACRVLRLRIPMLCTSHGGDLYGLRGGFFDRLKRIVFRHCRAVTLVSRAMKRDAARIGGLPEKTRVIPMGVDLADRFVPGRRKRGDTVLFVGRLVEKKGAADLVDALPRILDEHPGARIRIAGDGPERERLFNRCRRLGVESNVRFLGAVPHSELPDLYRSADVLVFPSVVAGGGDREGFGLVVVEALGCECAVVVTDLPAMADIVTDGANGLVVPANAPDRIAGAVGRLLSDSGLRESLGKSGRLSVLEKYDWPIIAGEYRRTIESIRM